jgi:hypothetical protein
VVSIILARILSLAQHANQRAVKLCDGNSETNLMQGDATLQRLTREIDASGEVRASAEGDAPA